MVQQGPTLPASCIATTLFISIGGLSLFELAGKIRFAPGPDVSSLDAICPVDGTMKGGYACDGGAVARRVYNMSGAEQVRRLSSVSVCDFDRLVGRRDPHPWPPSKPMLVSSPAGWSLEKFGREKFVERFKDWRWPLSTFLRDPWLTLVGRQGEVGSGAVEVTLEEYLQVRNITGRNLFLFLRDEATHVQQGFARAELRHKFFEALEQELPAMFRTSLRIFAMDGLAAGHGMHRHGEAFLASLAGRKLWWVAPPHVESGMVGGRPSFPYKDLTPEEGGWPCSWLLQEELVPPGVLRCVQSAGEVVLLPAGWWHMTCSLDEFNIAVGGQEV